MRLLLGFSPEIISHAHFRGSQLIAGVLFDMGGTILDYGGPGGWEATLDAAFRVVHGELAAAGYTGDYEPFHLALRTLEDRRWAEATAGQRNLTCEDELVELLGLLALPPDHGLAARAARAYGQSVQSTCVVFPDSAEGLAALKAMGLKLGLVSNTMLPGELHVEDLARHDLLPYFDDLVFSGDVGLWKPQPGVFRLALDRLGLHPEEAIFVGDRLIDDVGGAQGVGIRGVLRLGRVSGPDYAEGTARGIEPDARIRAITELADLVESLASVR